MKTRHYITALLAGASSLAFVACAPKKETPTPTTSTSANGAVDRTMQTASNAASQAGEYMENSWDKIKDATYDQRAQFESSLKDMTASVDQKIDAVQARSSSASNATKDKLDQGLKQLRDARADLQAKIADLGDATAATWDNAKASVASAWERVHDAYNNLQS